MSISSEISRISSAKAAMKTEIEKLGVTIPDDATIDEYTTYLAQAVSNLPSKYRLLKVGTISMNWGYDQSASARTKKLNISSVYPNYAKLTLDDICFPLTYSRGWGDGFAGTLSNFKKAYEPSTGIITITATGSYNYCNTQFTCDVYILDRVGGS